MLASESDEEEKESNEVSQGASRWANLKLVNRNAQVDSFPQPASIILRSKINPKIVISGGYSGK